MSLPKEWTEEKLPLGTAFTFHASQARGARGSLVLGIAILALCLYWDWLFIKNWFVDRAEILPAGVVLFLVILGGAFLGLYCLRKVFSSTTYFLGGDSLTVMRRSFGQSAEDKFMKAQIQAINLLFTASKDAAHPDTWTVTIDIKDLRGGTPASLALEGNGEPEAKYLSQQLSSWSGAAIRYHNTLE